MMDLTENDKEFLEKIGKQLGPEPAPFNGDIIKKLYIELIPVMDQFHGEIAEFSLSLIATYPNVLKHIELYEDLADITKLMFAHGFIRAWQTRDHNDQT
jgi:hypothetical protein